MRRLQRARMWPLEMMPDWVFHCEAFVQSTIQLNEELGEFKVDVSQVIKASTRFECGSCSFPLPHFLGYRVASGINSGSVIPIVYLDLAEDPLEIVP